MPVMDEADMASLQSILAKADATELQTPTNFDHYISADGFFPPDANAMQADPRQAWLGSSSAIGSIQEPIELSTEL